MKRLFNMPWWFVISLVILTAVSAWLRLYRLGDINLHQDEFYQFETAVGYSNTGEYKRWDFYRGATQPEIYDRAKLYTWQVAQSIQWFGVSAASARYPAVLWGIVLIPLTAVLVVWLTQNKSIAIGLSALLTFDWFMIDMARYNRMYTLVFVLTFIIMALWYRFFVTRSTRERVGIGLGLVVAIIMNWSLFKELTIATLGALAVYTAIRGVIAFITKDPLERWWKIGLLVGTVSVVLLVLIQLFIMPWFPVQAFVIRGHKHWIYFKELFTEWRSYWAAIILACAGIALALKQWRSWYSLHAITVVIVLVYFVFLSNRWDAFRYVGFILPSLYILIVLSVVTILGWLKKRLRLPVAVGIVTSVVSFIVIGPALSFPGLPGDNALWVTTYGDRSHAALEVPDMKTAYQYVTDHYQPGEVVLIQGPRFYYWPDNSIPVYKLDAYKRLPYEQFVGLAQLGEKGGWFIYNAPNKRHLKKGIMELADAEFEYIDSLEPTLVKVYYFTPDDLPEIDL